MAAKPLTDLDRLRTIYGIIPADTTQVGIFNLLIAEASQLITDWCGYKTFGPHPVTQILNGNGTNAIWLAELPVQSVTTINLDNSAFGGNTTGSFGSTTLLDPTKDYYLDCDNGPGTPSSSGIIYRNNDIWDKRTYYIQGLIGGVFGPGSGNILVVYQAGHQTPPGPVQAACELMVAKMMKSRFTGDTVKGYSYEESSITLAGDNKYGLLTPEIRILLAPYKKATLAG